MNPSGADSVARHWCAAAPEVCAADSEAPTDGTSGVDSTIGRLRGIDCDWAGPAAEERLAAELGRNARDDGGVEAFEGDELAAREESGAPLPESESSANATPALLAIVQPSPKTKAAEPTRTPNEPEPLTSPGRPTFRRHLVFGTRRRELPIRQIR